MVRCKTPEGANYIVPWKGWRFPQEQPGTGSLRGLHRDWWVKRTDEPNNLKFERMKIIPDEQGQQPPFGGSTAGVSIHALENWSPGESYHWLSCPFGCLCSGTEDNTLQAHSSAALGSCPCIPQVFWRTLQKQKQQWLSGLLLVLLQSKSVSVFQSPVQTSTLFLCRSLQ